MHIFIVTDLEGISGIGQADQILPENAAEYHKCCEHLMEDVNAAVQGALDGGAHQVTVLDGHGGGRNFLPGKLHPKAVQELGPYPACLAKGFDAMFLVGYHAMAGTIGGFLDHTQSSLSWYNYYVNGRRTGEIGQMALAAASCSRPVVLVTGDEAACFEARQFLGEIETVAVKRAVGRNCAQLVEPAEARKAIYLAAKAAVPLAGKLPPYRPLLPMELKLELCRTDYAESLLSRPGVERLDARTIRKISENYADYLF